MKISHNNKMVLLIWLAMIMAAQPVSSAPAPEEDGRFFPSPPRNNVTFWGHACCYIDVDGFGIVTDPVFAGRYVFRRRKIPVPPRQSLVGTRLILISHAHMDHLHPGTIAMFPDSAIVLCPWTVPGYLEDTGKGFKIMRPGDVYEYSRGKIVAVEAEHPGKRYALRKGGEDDAIGFIITTPYGNIYYSGDTGYFEGMIDIGAEWQPQIAIICITPHLKGESAVRAVWATRAEVVIPVHFGAYDYILFGPLKQPRGYNDIAPMISEQAVLLQPGESISIESDVRKSADQKPKGRLE